MDSIFWSEFGILFIAALAGGAAVLPYALKLLKKSSAKKPLKLSMTALVWLSFLQTAVVSALAVGIGLFVAHKIGLGAPFLEAALRGAGVQGIGQMITVAGVSGALAGIVLLLADLRFLPHWPQALYEASRQTTVKDNFLASFYGGINEEIFMRLLGFSVFAWLFSAFHASSSVALWSANIVMTIIFGVGHLPALKNILGNLPPLMVARSLLLNAPIGLLCGWLFWTYGIEAAMIAHFSADIIYHVFGTIVLLRSKVRPSQYGM